MDRRLLCFWLGLVVVCWAAEEPPANGGHGSGESHHEGPEHDELKYVPLTGPWAFEPGVGKASIKEEPELYKVFPDDKCAPTTYQIVAQCPNSMVGWWTPNSVYEYEFPTGSKLPPPLPIAPCWRRCTCFWYSSYFRNISGANNQAAKPGGNVFIEPNLPEEHSEDEEDTLWLLKLLIESNKQERDDECEKAPKEKMTGRDGNEIEVACTSKGQAYWVCRKNLQEECNTKTCNWGHYRPLGECCDRCLTAKEGFASGKHYAKLFGCFGAALVALIAMFGTACFLIRKERNAEREAAAGLRSYVEMEDQPKL